MSIRIGVGIILWKNLIVWAVGVERRVIMIRRRSWENRFLGKIAIVRIKWGRRAD